ncbi:MAG: hypothetical protein ABIZ04_00545 [Opitutus sp.]
MFRRLVLENSTALVTIVAFITASSIYVAFAWRALRMRPKQLNFLENLPFATPTPRAIPPSTATETAPATAHASRVV